MASSAKMKGIILEIGGDASPLAKALDDVNKKSKGIQDELRQVEKLLKLDPTNTELLAQKQKLLSDSTAAAREKLAALNNIQEEFNKKVASGEIEKGSAQYREMERQVIEAEVALKKAQNAQEEFAKQTDKSGKEAKEAGEEAEKAGKKAKSSGEEAKSGGSGWEKFGEMAKSAGKVAIGTIGAISAAAIGVGKAVWDAANDTAEAFDVIDKGSQKLGLSRKAYQEWDYVLSQAGVDIESMSAGLKTLTNKIDDAKNGSVGAREMFQRLGISVEDLKNMSREDIFKATIQGFQGMADSTERAALANDLFGRSGQDLTALFNETAESTEALIQKAHEYGMIVGEDAVQAGVDFNDSLDTLKRAFEGLKNGLIAKMLPIFQNLIDGFTKLVSGSKGAAESIKGAVGGLVLAVKDGISGLLSTILDYVLPAIIEIAPQLLTGLISIILDGIPKLEALALELIMAVVQTLLSPASIEMILNTAIQLVIQLAMGLTTALPQLIRTVIDGALTILKSLSDPKVLRGILDALMTMCFETINGLYDMYPLIIETLPAIIDGLIDFLTSPKTLDMVLNGYLKMFSCYITAIKNTAVAIAKALPPLVKSIANGLISAVTYFTDLGANLIKGVWNGMKSTGDWLWRKISGFFGGVVDRIKNFFGIHSPSTVFRDMIGKNLVKGIEVGVELETPNLKDDLEKNLAAATAAVSTSVSTEGISINATGAAGTLGGIHFEIGTFVNNTEKDLQGLMQEALEIAETYLQRREEAFA